MKFTAGGGGKNGVKIVSISERGKEPFVVLRMVRFGILADRMGVEPGWFTAVQGDCWGGEVGESREIEKLDDLLFLFCGENAWRGMESNALKFFQVILKCL